MDKFNDNKKLMSDFNEAGFQILRLHDIWVRCGTAAARGELDKWKWLLDRAWIELASDAKKKNEEKYFKEVNELDKNVTTAKKRNEIYAALKEKEIFIRCLQDDVGKGARRTEHYEEIM